MRPSRRVIYPSWARYRVRTEQQIVTQGAKCESDDRMSVGAVRMMINRPLKVGPDVC